MYTVTWYRFEHGKETDAIITKSRDFEEYYDAERFLMRRLRYIKSRYWAGGFIADEYGIWLMGITSSGDVSYS